MTNTSIIAAEIQRALALHGQGQISAAAAIYKSVLGQQPDHFDALHLLGVAHLQQGELAEAERLIAAAVKINPRYAPALANLGTVLRSQKKNAEALQAFDAAAAQQPTAENHLNRGLALLDLARFVEALAAFEQAVALNPDHPDAHQGRSSALERLGRFEEAVAACDAALRIRPEHTGTLYNRARALYALGRPSEAEPLLRRAIALQPDLAEAHWALGETLLLSGADAEGWREYEWRWKSQVPTGGAGGEIATFQRSLPMPQWQGESIAGKTVLIHAEQGYGDTLHFCRYVRDVADRGGRVLLEVQPPLKRLLSNIKGAAEVLARGEPLPAADHHCPLLSLPLALGRTSDKMPAAVPYVAPAQELVAKWRERLGGAKRPLIGLTWFGMRDAVKERHRSIPAQALPPLADVDATFVSLQLELRDDDRAVDFTRDRVRRVEFGDFADTAALMAALDLVVTVDTANAHLAGAMGKPVWILLSTVADWRWGLRGETTPWYPTARLFRQPAPGAWDAVIARVRESLRAT